MRTFRVWAPLCVAALATGGAFSILFTGDTVDGASGGFGEYSLAAFTGHSAFWLVLFAALAAVFVGSAGSYRFVLIFPAATVYTLFAAYGPPPLLPRSGFGELFVEWREWAMNIGFDVYQAADTMYAEPIPYDLSPGLMVILIPVIMIVVAFATSATLYEESPVISVAVLGLTIGVLSTISFEDGAGPFFFVLLVASVVLLLSSGGAFSRESGEAGAIGWPGLIAGLFAISLVLMLPKAPFSDETVSSGLIDWTRIGTGGTSQLDVQADVGDYLTYGRDAELLRIRSDEPLLWRGGTLDYFDGVRWSNTTEPGLAYGEEVSPTVETRFVRQNVRVLDARMNRLFGGYKIVTQTIRGAQRNSDGSWSVDRPLSEGSEYTVYSDVPQPTQAQLQGAGTNYTREVTDKYLQLPDNRPDVIAETAETIERRYSPDTPYEKARSIEKYLLYDGNFTYNLDVSYRRADKAIEEFLDKDGPREGFCTQFATSMALIAREMDVPSRVVYGATPGDRAGDDEYVVTGSNMHTWVEIYFPGVGWYTFDPTPGFTVPSTMEANAPRPQIVSTRQSPILESNLQRQRAAQSDPQKDQPKPDEKQAAKRSSSGGETPAWPIYALLPVLAVAAIPLLKRMLLARGRPVDLYRDLTGRLRDVLPPGRGAIADSPALTPTERLLLLAGAAGIEEEAFRELARAYSDYLYSAGGGGVKRRMRAAYRPALRAFERLPPWRRLLGAVNPASLLARIRYRLSSARARAGKALRGRFRWRR